MACEDYPCCGHEPGDCPREDAEGNQIWSCARCRTDLPPRNRSSLCDHCIGISIREDETDFDHQD